MNFTDCASNTSGGGLHVHGDFAQLGGSIEFYGCIAERSGGGLWVNGSFHQAKGAANFSDCRALGSGGGLNVAGSVTLAGTNMFTECRAAAAPGQFSNMESTVFVLNRRNIPMYATCKRMPVNTV